MRLSAANETQQTKRQMARSAAAMYAGATFLGISQALTSEGPESTVVPGLVSLLRRDALLVRGVRRLPDGAVWPRWARWARR